MAFQQHKLYVAMEAY